MEESTEKEMDLYKDGYDAGIVDANRQCIDKVKERLDDIYDRAVDGDTIEDLDEIRNIINEFQDYQKNRD